MWELIFPVREWLECVTQSRRAGGEYPTCTHGAHSTITVVPIKVVPSGAQRHEATCATMCQLCAA